MEWANLIVTSLGWGFQRGESSKTNGKTVFVKSKVTESSEPPKLAKRFVPTCHHCGVVGHIRPFCQNRWKPKQTSKSSQSSDVASSIQSSLENFLKEFSRIAQSFSLPKETKLASKRKNIRVRSKEVDSKKVDQWDKAETDSESDEDEPVCFFSRCNVVNLDSVIKPEDRKVVPSATTQDSKPLPIPTSEDKIVALCNVALTAFSARSADTWYVDSGSSKHMTGNKNWF